MSGNGTIRSKDWPVVTPGEFQVIRHLRRTRERSRGRQTFVLIELVNGVIKISDVSPKGVIDAG